MWSTASKRVWFFQRNVCNKLKPIDVHTRSASSEKRDSDSSLSSTTAVYTLSAPESRGPVRLQV